MSTIRLIPTRPTGSPLLTYLVGDDVLSGGVGGWQDLERPLRRAAIEYVGTPGFVYELPLLFNGVEFFPGRDLHVEAACIELMRWGNRNPKTGRPQVLRLEGAALKSPPRVRWVIEALSWGESWRDVNGRRIQQYVTVTLREFVEAEVLRSPAKASRERRNRGGGRNGDSGYDPTGAPGGPDNPYGYGTPDPGYP